MGDRLGPGREPGIEELIAGLTATQRRLLAAGGLTPERLHAMAATPDGALQVRQLIARTAGPVAHRPPQRPAVQSWLGLLAVAVLGVLLCAGLAVLVGPPALFAGVAWGILVLPLALYRLRPEPRPRFAVPVLAAGFLVLAVLVPYNAADWYLAAAGRTGHALLAAPARHEDRARVTRTCRVGVPGDGLREVARNDDRCLAETGRQVPVVYDPAGWFAPHLGTVAGLSAPVTAPIGAAAALAVVIPPLAVVVLDVRRRQKEPQ